MMGFALIFATLIGCVLIRSALIFAAAMLSQPIRSVLIEAELIGAVRIILSPPAWTLCAPFSTESFDMLYSVSRVWYQSSSPLSATVSAASALLLLRPSAI